MKQQAVLTDQEIARKKHSLMWATAGACIAAVVVVMWAGPVGLFTDMLALVMFLIALMISAAKLEWVTAAEMTSLYKAVENIPAAKDELCRILQVRQRVTKSEYCRIADMITAGNIAAAEEKWDKIHATACQDHGMLQHAEQD